MAYNINSAVYRTVTYCKIINLSIKNIPKLSNLYSDYLKFLPPPCGLLCKYISISAYSRKIFLLKKKCLCKVPNILCI